MEVEKQDDLTDELIESESDYAIPEYNLSIGANDFNVMTLASYVDAGAIKIPAFQRNYVWDIKRASRLIESLILGIPVPQLFLYEENKNSYLIIDGQQRLLTVYYFTKGRFPRKEKRLELRRMFSENPLSFSEVLGNDDYFRDLN